MYIYSLITMSVIHTNYVCIYSLLLNLTDVTFRL
jgi:hypothetical protein